MASSSVVVVEPRGKGVGAFGVAGEDLPVGPFDLHGPVESFDLPVLPWAVGLDREVFSTDRRESRGEVAGADVVQGVVADDLAYAEILEDETGPTCAAFLIRAAGFFSSYGITVREVITDNAKNYYPSSDFQAAIASIDARHLRIKPHCPWQNGKVERFNRTVQIEWAYRQVYNSNDERTAALAPWLDYYNTRRRHSAIGGQPPISRLSPTS